MSHLETAYRQRSRFLLHTRRWAPVPLADREDTLQQAVCELVGHSFKSAAHAGNTLELRFAARMADQVRRRNGRGGDAIWHSIPLEVRDDFGRPDRHGVTEIDPERIVVARDTLRRLVTALGPRQRASLREQHVTPDTIRKRRYRARLALKGSLLGGQAPHNPRDTHPLPDCEAS